MSVTLTVAPVQVVLRTSTVVAVDGADGVGIPAGGSAGQVLAKTSGADYATGWTDLADTSDPAGTADAALLAHVAAADPHPLYRLEAAAVPWADLSGVVSVTAGTGLTGGGALTATVALAVSFGTTSTTACVGDDARLGDSRPPSGSAGGDLTGSYPNPTLAAVVSAASVGAADKTIALTIDAKGRVTAVADTAIAIDGSQVNAGTLPIARIAANAVTNAKLAQVATATFKGRTTAGTGDVEDLTAAQVAATLPAASVSAISTTTASFSGNGTHTIDFATAQQQFHVATCTAAMTLTIAASNIAANKHCSLIIDNTGAGTVTISWSGFAATAIGSALPTTLATGKKMVLAMSCAGTTAASVVVSWASQP